MISVSEMAPAMSGHQNNVLRRSESCIRLVQMDRYYRGYSHTVSRDCHAPLRDIVTGALFVTRVPLSFNTECDGGLIVSSDLTTIIGLKGF